MNEQQSGLLRRVLTVVLALVLVVAVLASVYIALNPQPSTDPYTEFYVLNANGTAADYPTNLSVGESGVVTVGITNHEYESVTYTVVLRLGNRTVETRTTTLADGRTWERRFSFSPQSSGRTRLRLSLYRGQNPNGSTAPYRSLGLWVNTTATDPSARLAGA